MGCGNSKSATAQGPSIKATSAVQTQSNGITTDTSTKAVPKQPSPPLPVQSKLPIPVLSPEKPLSTNTSKQEFPSATVNIGKTTTQPTVSLSNQRGNEQTVAELRNKGPFEEPYDPDKTVKLSIGDFEGTFKLTTTCNLDKSTESLYSAVTDKLHHSQFTLIHQGKVLPADSTSLGAYGVRESGQIDCLVLSLKS